MKKKPLLVAVPVLLVAGVAAWLLLRSGNTEADALTASGTVEATEADLAFPVPGRIAEIGPREGDVVSAGTELARLDTRELEAGRAAAEAQLNAAEARLAELQSGSRSAEVAQAEAALRSATQRSENARRDAERAQRLHEGGAVSRQMLEDALTALEVAEAARDQAEQALELVREGPRSETIRSQRALVAQARANLERADIAVSNGVIEAPFAGIVTVRHRQPGETVPAGAPVLTVLDPDDRWVRIYVREDQVGRLALGMPARISADTYPERIYEGEVAHIASEAEFTPRNVQTAEERTRLVYAVKVRITGDAGFELKPGIPADVSLGAAGS